MFAERQDGEIEIEAPQTFLLKHVGESSVKDVDDGVGVAGAGYRHVRSLHDVLLHTPETCCRCEKMSLTYSL